jgi:hypothetical protein
MHLLETAYTTLCHENYLILWLLRVNKLFVLPALIFLEMWGWYFICQTLKDLYLLDVCELTEGQFYDVLFLWLPHSKQRLIFRKYWFFMLHNLSGSWGPHYSVHLWGNSGEAYCCRLVSRLTDCGFSLDRPTYLTGFQSVRYVSGYCLNMPLVLVCS